MGLDQYIYAEVGDKQVEVMYWRKDYEVNHYMYKGYLEEGGMGESYGFSVKVTLSMLTDLIKSEITTSTLFAVSAEDPGHFCQGGERSEAPSGGGTRPAWIPTHLLRIRIRRKQWGSRQLKK